MGGAGTRRRGPQVGADAEVRLDLEFAEAVFGSRKEITVRLPGHLRHVRRQGHGRRAPSPSPASTARAPGELRRVRQSLLGQVVTSVACSRCSGTGEMIPNPCADCRGEGRRMQENTFTVEVPAGVEEGSTLRLADRGAAGQRGGPNGSLFVHLVINPDPRFERQADNLHTTLTISVAQAALGTETDVETLDGPQHLTIGPGTQHGHVERIRSLGVPHLRGRGRGDFYVHVLVATPTDLTPEQDELLRQFAAARGEEVSAPGARGRRGRVLAPALRLWLAPTPPHAAIAVRAAAAARSSWTTPAGRCSPTRTRTTWAGCCGSAMAKRSLPPTGAAAGRAPRGAARRRSSRSRTGAVSAATAPCSPRPAPSRALTVAFAPVKGERPEWVVQKLTELGIDRIVPLRSERSVVRWTGARGQASVEKLRRVAREAAAQCRRVWLPEVSDTVAFADLPASGRARRGRPGAAERGPAHAWPSASWPSGPRAGGARTSSRRACPRWGSG